MYTMPKWFLKGIPLQARRKQRYPHWSRLFILAIAVWVSCLGVFQFADDPSQARLILADMILAKHFIAILTYGGFC